MDKCGGFRVRAGWNVFLGAARNIKASLSDRVTQVLRDRSAVTSIEFAVMALPFFALTFLTMSVGAWYFSVTCVDIAVYKAGRQIMTGNFQTENITTPAAFSNSLLCPNMPAVSCSASNPVVHMAVVNNFNSLFTQHTQTISPGPPPVTFTWESLNPMQNVICSPQQGSMVFLEVDYQMPTFLSFFTVFTGISNGNTANTMFNRTISSGATVKIEEFPTGSASFSNCAGVTGTPCCPA